MQQRSKDCCGSRVPRNGRCHCGCQCKQWGLAGSKKKQQAPAKNTPAGVKSALCNVRNQFSDGQQSRAYGQHLPKTLTGVKPALCNVRNQFSDGHQCLQPTYPSYPSNFPLKYVKMATISSAIPHNSAELNCPRQGLKDPSTTQTNSSSRRA